MVKKILFMLTGFIFCLNLSAQDNITVKGTVIDTENEPIVGGSIIIKGTKTGTVTDVDGHFVLPNLKKDAVLVFSYIGMNTREVKVNGKTELNVTLKSSNVSLDELVVVAYGVQSKRALTTSISNVNTEKLKDVPVNSIDQALQGRATGVSIITPTGGVGEAPIVRVRGVSSITSGTQPLYIVDGMPIETGNTSYSGNVNALADINPADIVSMAVLKDAAAAAMYGSRAANGVILITTRQGSKGKTRVSYDGYVGFTNATKFFDVMNAQQYVDFKNMAVKNRYGTDEMSLTANYTSKYGDKAFNQWKLSDGSLVDTDWSKEVLRTGIEHSHTVSLSGGSDKAQFFLSGNYDNQKGMVKGDKYSRFSLSANGNVNATNWMRLGGSVKASTSSTSYTDGARKGGQYATEGFTRLALILPPNVPAYNEDGTPYLGESGYIGRSPNTVFNGYTNPAALLYYGSGVNTDIIRFIGMAFAEFHLAPGLVFKTQYGMDYSHVDDQNFRTAMMFGDYENGAAINYSAKRTNATWTNTLSYLFSLDKHHFDVILGEESNEKKLNRWGATRSNLLDNKFTSFQGAWASITAGGGNALSESSLLSYFGRINYDYNEKYLFSLNFRRDGYSALSKDNRWGNFGGVSAAWRISSEKFFAPLRHVVNDLKIKGSWGRVGNTNIADYAAFSYYNSSYYGGEGAYVLGQIADSKNLKWETSEKVDFGVSATLWNRINIDFDFYHDKSSDLILNIPVARSKGIPNNYITTNAGAMKNYGIEANIGATVIRTKDFSWNSSFNITTTKNEVTKLAEGVENITSGSYNITEVGKSIGRLYLYPTGGIDEKTGRRIFYGADGTKVLCMYEKSGKFFTEDGKPYAESNLKPVDCGNTIPTYYGGWTNEFKYKNWDATIMFQFSGGNKIYNGTTATCSDMRYWNNTKDVYKNYWSENHTHAKYAYPIYGDNYSNGSSKPISDWVENGDYLRCKNISVGYTFNPSSLHWGVSSIRLYVQAQNLFVITGYSGLDPEACTMSTNANLQGGIDKNTLPQARTITCGLNVVF